MKKALDNTMSIGVVVILMEIYGTYFRLVFTLVFLRFGRSYPLRPSSLITPIGKQLTRVYNFEVIAFFSLFLGELDALTVPPVHISQKSTPIPQHET
jgi:hypothetical protein